MVESIASYYIIGNILTFLSQFCIWIMCLLLFIRERTWPSILLFAGSTLVIAGTTAGVLIQTLIARTSSPEELLLYQGFMYIINALFILIFAVGLVLFILRYLKLDKALKASATS